MSALVPVTGPWQNPDRPPFSFDVEGRSWDRRGELLAEEAEAVASLGPTGLRRNRARSTPRRTAAQWEALSRLVEPLDAARASLHHREDVKFRRAGAHAVAAVLQHCVDISRSYWAWTEWDWAGLCRGSAREFVASKTLPTEVTVRPFVIALGYLLGTFTGFQHLGTFNRLHLATLVFGEDAVEDALGQVGEVVGQWGYRGPDNAKNRMRGSFSQALLLNRSPRLEDLTTEAFATLRAHPASQGHHGELLFAFQRGVAALGHCDPPVRRGYNHAAGIQGTAPAWASWVERWQDTSTLSPKVRAIVRTTMAKAGRWLADVEPEITEPGQWTRQTCASWVAAVDRMGVGDYVQRRDQRQARAGEPILPRIKAHILVTSRTFFRDCQEWEWIPRRFDPSKALAVPRSVSALIGTDPRIIADDVWAKLLWAGLNRETTDLPGGNTYYPLELIRALTLTWLFSGLRSDEIARLRVGRIRWQHDGHPIAGDAHDVLAADAVCLLDVPVHKTGTGFTKPVDALVGQAIEAWQQLRPAQPSRLDAKTGEHVDVLFSFRAQPVAKSYINRTVIPGAVLEGRRPHRRRSRRDHQPPSPIHHRKPALQRQRADDAVRAAGLARTQEPRHHPALRQDHPEHAVQGGLRLRLTS